MLAAHKRLDFPLPCGNGLRVGSTRYKAKRAPRTPDGGCSSVHEIVLHGIYSGISQEANTSPERLLTGCKDIGSALTAAREWHRVIAYVEQIVGLKTAFANYDLGFCALNPLLDCPRPRRAGAEGLPANLLPPKALA